MRAIHLPSGIDTKLLPDDEFATEKFVLFVGPTRMTDKLRLIEVAFPLKQASLTSVHEKNVRHVAGGTCRSGIDDAVLEKVKPGWNLS